jgi:hypothetical protein
MIAHDAGQCAGPAKLFNHQRKPAPVCLVVFNATYLFAGIDHQAIRNGYPHLVFHKRTVGQVLNHVVRIHFAPCGNLPGLLELDRNHSGKVRIRQSGLPEIPQRADLNTFASKG